VQRSPAPTQALTRLICGPFTFVVVALACESIACSNPSGCPQTDLPCKNADRRSVNCIIQMENLATTLVILIEDSPLMARSFMTARVRVVSAIDDRVPRMALMAPRFGRSEALPCTRNDATNALTPADAIGLVFQSLGSQISFVAHQERKHATRESPNSRSYPRIRAIVRNNSIAPRETAKPQSPPSRS